MVVMVVMMEMCADCMKNSHSITVFNGNSINTAATAVDR
jgi:hypothetical protein